MDGVRTWNWNWNGSLLGIGHQLHCNLANEGMGLVWSIQHSGFFFFGLGGWVGRIGFYMEGCFLT